MRYNLRVKREARVEIINDSSEKLELQYPCSWCYKVIGSEKAALESAIKEVILEREHSLQESNKSATGKYISLNLELLVHNEEDRNFIYEALKAHNHIKMVL